MPGTISDRMSVCMYNIYIYAIYTSRWYVRNYVRIMCQGGDHSKKVRFVFPCAREFTKPIAILFLFVAWTRTALHALRIFHPMMCSTQNWNYIDYIDYMKPCHPLSKAPQQRYPWWDAWYLQTLLGRTIPAIITFDGENHTAKNTGNTQFWAMQAEQLASLRDRELQLLKDTNLHGAHLPHCPPKMTMAHGPLWEYSCLMLFASAWKGQDIVRTQICDYRRKRRFLLNSRGGMRRSPGRNMLLPGFKKYITLVLCKSTTCKKRTYHSLEDTTQTPLSGSSSTDAIQTSTELGVT